MRCRIASITIVSGLYFFSFVFSDFELEKEKSVLDEQGLRIAENQENSQKNRRKLAENTRGMRS